MRSYQEARALLEKLPPNPDDLFDQACTYGACSMLVGQGKAELTPKDQAQQKADADLAVKTLRQAVNAGFRDLDRAKNAVELDALKTHQGFIEALVEIEKKAKTLDWQIDMEAAKLLAQKEKKDLFIYFTGSDWCQWCLLVRSQVFGKPVFIDYVKKNFIMVELDFPHNKPAPKNHAKNTELLRSWGLRGFPSLILADPQGRPYTNLRDGRVRDDAADYVNLMTKSRQDRQTRDEWFAKAAAAEGIEKANCLDKALSLVSTQFLQAGYPDALARILELDPDDKAGLREKYLPQVMTKSRLDVQDLMKKQDWDGTILKIDKIIEDLKPTDTQAADFWIERARAHVKLNQLDRAEVDFEKAVNLKPADAAVRLERGKFYEKLGNPQKAAVDFSAAIEPWKKTVESARATFNRTPHLRANREALSKACFSLGEVYRKAGQLPEAIA
ncbi:MAG TPA: thioredoxin family protein, partial [Gemmataceae bacterium]|nr:thioredoxin family protein [Gemmataceae bacterium]